MQSAPRSDAREEGLQPLVKVAGGLTLALLAAGAMYLWVVRGEMILLDGFFAALCL